MELPKELNTGMDRNEGPAAPGTANLKPDMGKAVRTLEAQTERGSHIASVGGIKVPGHSGKEQS